MRWQEISKLITQTRVTRLRDLQATDYRRQYEVYELMEQYDRAYALLSQMLAEPKRFAREHQDGWLSLQFWETGLLASARPRPEILERYFTDWKEKVQKRLEVKEADAEWVAYYKKQEWDSFRDRQEYYGASESIAETLKDLDVKGDGFPEPLWDLCQRYRAKHPDAPLSCLRTLYKLREWYAEFPECRSGEVQKRILLVLQEVFGLYRDAAQEAERLTQDWPDCHFTKDGDALYWAAENWFHLGNALTPKHVKLASETKVQFNAREAQERANAREAWSKARGYYRRLQREHLKHWSNRKDRDSAGTILNSHNENRLNVLNAPHHLGPG